MSPTPSPQQQQEQTAQQRSLTQQQQQQQQQLQQHQLQQLQLQQQRQLQQQQQHQLQQQQQQQLLQQQQQQIHRTLNQNIQNIKMDIHSLQEALKNPNLTPQARQEKETKLNYYSNLLRAPISVSPMVRTSSMPLNTLTSTGALSSQTGPILTSNTVSTMQQQQQFSSASQTTSQSPTVQIPLHLQQDNLTMLSATSSLSTITNIRPNAPIVPITSAITTSFSPSLTLSSNAYLTSNLPPGTSQLQITDPDNIEKPIVAKCNIQELVEQIDPRERLEPEVEDLLLDVADEFITSVASFGCQLAKHRKTDTLEVKDLQLHLERNWNIRIPGFASDEIRSVRKPVIATAHQQKLAAVNNAQAQSH